MLNRGNWHVSYEFSIYVELVLTKYISEQYKLVRDIKVILLRDNLDDQEWEDN